MPADDIRESIDSGAAFAALHADQRDRTEGGIQVSPTLLLNEGRQRLCGNVGYRVIEANIEELLQPGDSGAASWC